MAYLSRQQVKDIIQNAPEGTDPGKIVQELVVRGHQLEGFDNTQTPAATTQTPTTNAPKEDGFVKSVVKSIAKPVTTGLASGARAIQSTPDLLKATFGNKEALNRAQVTQAQPVDLPFFGKTTPLAGLNNKQAVGLAAQTAGNIINPIAGSALGAGGESLAQGDDPKTIALKAGTAILLTKYGPKVAGKILNKLPTSVKTAASNLANKVASKTAEPVNTAISNTSTKILSKPAQKVSGLVDTAAGKFALGDDLASAVSKLGSDTTRVEAYQAGERTFQDVANKTATAVKEFQDTSFNGFKAVTDSLPGQAIGKTTVTKAVNPLMKAEGLLPGEKIKVNAMKKIVSGWKDFSDKGVLSLRNKLDRAGLYVNSEEFQNSNKILGSVRNALNDLVTTKHPFIKDALEAATNDIQMLDQLEANVIGKNTQVYIERTASNLKRIAAKLNDPAQAEATKTLLQNLQQETGIDILGELEASRAGEILRKQLSSPGINSLGGSAKTLVKRGVVKGFKKAAETTQKAKTLSQIKGIKTDLSRFTK